MGNSGSSFDDFTSTVEEAFNKSPVGQIVDNAKKTNVNETIDEVKDKANEIKDKAKDKVNEAKDKIVDTANDIKDKATETFNKVKDKVKDLTDYLKNPLFIVGGVVLLLIVMK